MSEVRPLWEKVMGFIPTKGPRASRGAGTRPRRFSIHALASVCEADPLRLLDEMEASGKVRGYACPDVGGAVVFYLSNLASIMIDTPAANCWALAKEHLGGKWPFPAVRGFWSPYHDGKYIPAPGGRVTMDRPFMPFDAEYEAEVREFIRKEREA